MPKNKILEATNGIVGILDPFEGEDRRRIIAAALTVLGEQDVPLTPPAGGGEPLGSGARRGQSAQLSEKAYLDQKDPQTKGEELATAARFREEHQSATESTKEELRAVLKAARRNFDDNNYRRDLDNARVAGLFNRGTGRDAAVLSHFGQKYVDALPDRDAAKALPKPKGAGRRASAKRTAAKKPTSR